jgi:hypothetical protein
MHLLLQQRATISAHCADHHTSLSPSSVLPVPARGRMVHHGSSPCCGTSYLCAEPLSTLLWKGWRSMSLGPARPMACGSTGASDTKLNKRGTRCRSVAIRSFWDHATVAASRRRGPSRNWTLALSCVTLTLRRAALMVSLLCYSAMRDTLILSAHRSRPPTLLCE